MYGKIFESIYEGSLYGQYEAIVTFQALIVLADEDGLIDISPQALSGKTSIPLEVVRKGLKVLQQSDPHSRSPSEDGKRIVLLDEDREFGWRIVNYEYYRNLARRADTREKSRERKRRERERSSQVVDPEGCHAGVTPMSRKIAYTDTDTDTNKEETPAGLNQSAWDDYLSHRKDIRAKPLTKKGAGMAMKKLAVLSESDQQATVDLSISNGWQGLFPEKCGEKTKSSNSFDDKLANLRKKAGIG